MTLTPHFYSRNAPAIDARYRQLTKIGAFQIGGFLTYGRVDSSTTLQPIGQNAVRGYFEGNGKFQFNPEWSLTLSVRAATDKTVTRRFDLTRDDRLRSFADLERITPNSYISIAGWVFQGLRVDDRQRAIPIALPAIDARFRLKQKILGGRVELQANSLAITRIDGQDTQRAFVQARWDLRKLTRMGQELTFTALARGDVYHTDNSASNRDRALSRARRVACARYRRTFRRCALATSWKCVRRYPDNRPAGAGRADSAHLEPRHSQRRQPLDRP